MPVGARNGQALHLPEPASAEQAGAGQVNLALQQPEQALPADPEPAEQIQETPPPALAREGRAVQSPEAAPPPQHPRPGAVLEPGPEHDLPTLISKGNLQRVAAVSEPEHDLPTYVSQGDLKPITELPRPGAAPRLSRQRLSLLALVSLLVALALIGGSIYAFASRQNPGSRAQVTPTHVVQRGQTPTASATRAATPTTGPGLNIAGKYNGSMQANNGTNYTPLSLKLIQQDDSGALTGTATLNSSPQQTYQLQGIDDLQGEFTLVVQQPGGQLPLIFYGGLQDGSFLHGSYCHSAAPPCTSAEGYFTVGPRS